MAEMSDQLADKYLPKDILGAAEDTGLCSPYVSGVCDQHAWPSNAEISIRESSQLYMTHHLAHEGKPAFLSFEDKQCHQRAREGPQFP